MYGTTHGGERSKGARLLPLLFILFLGTCGRAQEILPDTAIYEYPRRTITVRDGLSRNQLNRVHKDSRGFVWLIGKRGFNRYDGMEVISYARDTSIESEVFVGVTEDYLGNVWLIANDGAYRYDGNTFERYDVQADEIIPFRFPAGDGKTICGYIDRLYVPWLKKPARFTDHQVSFGALGSANNRLVHFCTDSILLLDDTYYSLMPDSLIATTLRRPGKIAKVIGANHSFVPSVGRNNIEPRVLSGDSLFLIRGGQLIFDRAINIPPNYAGLLRDVNYLRGTKFSANGLLQTARNSLSLLEHPFPEVYHTNHILNDCYGDTTHLFVVGENGLTIIKPNSPVLLYPTKRGMAADVWSMVSGADAGAKTVGESGAAVSNISANYFFPYSRDSVIRLINGQYERFKPAVDGFYPGAMLSDDGSILVPNHSRVVRLDPFSDQIIYLDESARYATNDLLESGPDLYAATLGLAHYRNDRLLKIYGDKDGLDVTNLGYFESINQDCDGRLWLGSHKGLAVREPDGSFRNHLAGEGVPAGIVHGAKDYRGNLWFATHDGIAFHDYTDTLPRWVTPDFHEDVKFVHAIDSTWLLIAGVSQLYLLDLPKFYAGEIDLYPFDEDDGYPVVEALQASVMQDSEGIIWIGTTDGVVRLDPDKIKTYKEPTEPHFHSFGWLDESGEHEQTVVVPFNENGEQAFTVRSTDQNIDIRFFTINHDKPHAMRFRHRLVGYRDSWSQPSPVRTVNYGELPPGNYTFELQACLYGNCTENKSLGLRVAPARFWEYLATKLFFAGLVFTVFGIAGYQLYVRRRERFRAERQAQAFELERAEARRKLTVHKVGPHFANNALTAITDLIIHGENEAARRYTSHFAELFTPVLEDELGLLWTLSEEIAFINDYLQLEELRFGEKLSYSVEIDPTLEEAADDILVPTLLVQSFVNNAIKHGVEPIERGVLSVIVTQPERDYLQVRITDNGPGFASARPEDEGTGITAARVMVDYLNQYTETHSSITFSQSKADETTVTLRLYLHHQLID